MNGHDFGQTPGDCEGQGSLACCSLRGCKELDMTEQLKNNIVVQQVKNPPEIQWMQGTGDAVSVPESGRSLGESNGNLLQHSCLEKPMDRGTWRATVQRVTKSRT